jgi:hypothetical protein
VALRPAELDHRLLLLAAEAVAGSKPMRQRARTKRRTMGGFGPRADMESLL